MMLTAIGAKSAMAHGSSRVVMCAPGEFKNSKVSSYALTISACTSFNSYCAMRPMRSSWSNLRADSVVIVGADVARWGSSTKASYTSQSIKLLRHEGEVRVVSFSVLRKNLIGLW